MSACVHGAFFILSSLSGSLSGYVLAYTSHRGVCFRGPRPDLSQDLLVTPKKGKLAFKMHFMTTYWTRDVENSGSKSTRRSGGGSEIQCEIGASAL